MVRMSGPEARHMGTILRTEKAQTVRLFDGRGRDGLFTVRDIAKTRADLKAVELSEHPAPDGGLTLAVGWGKSKRRDYLLEKIVELQGRGLIFWQGMRSQGALPNDPKAAWNEKFVQAAKQCGAVRLPGLDIVSGGVDGLLSMTGNFDRCYLAWEAEEATTPGRRFRPGRGGQIDPGRVWSGDTRALHPAMGDRRRVLFESRHVRRTG